MSAVSERLLELVQHALDTAIDGVKRGERFSPFVVTEIGAQRGLARFDHLSPAEALEEARRVVECVPMEVDRYVIAHAGDITVGGESTPAIFADGGTRGGEAMRYAHRYRPAMIASSPASVIRERLAIGPIENLLDKDRFLVVVCPSCAAKNRVSLMRIREKNPVCGACRRSLAA